MTFKKYSQLIQLITIVGQALDKKKSYKFPLIACQLLSSDNPKIFQYILPNEGVVVVEDRVIRKIQIQVQKEIDIQDQQIEEQFQITDNQINNFVLEGQTAQKQQFSGDEEFGDFISTPPKNKKMIVVKQVIEVNETVKKQYSPLIGNLFQYFGKELNYTLTAYVCRVLLNLLNKKSLTFLKALFKWNNISNLINHIESRSVVELLVGVITIENSDFINQRFSLFLYLVHKLKNDDRVEILSNISVCACEVVEKIVLYRKAARNCQNFEMFVKKIPQLLQALIENIQFQNENIFFYSTNLICSLITLFNSLSNQNEENNNSKRFLLMVIQKGFAQIQKSILQQRNKLGAAKLKMIEVIRLLFNHEWMKDWATTKYNFYQLLLALIRLYPLNDILHGQVFKILGSSFNYNITLTQNLLKKLYIWLRQQIQIQKIQPKNKKRVSKHHLIKIWIFLRQATGSNLSVRKLVENYNYSNIFQLLLAKQIGSQARNLAGYMLKIKPCQIMHSRQEILKFHQMFLSNSPSSVYELDQNNPDQNPAKLQELQMQLDGIVVTDPNKPAQIIEQENLKAQLIQENQQHKSAFWKVHLEYDINDLINEVI